MSWKSSGSTRLDTLQRPIHGPWNRQIKPAAGVGHRSEAGHTSAFMLDYRRAALDFREKKTRLVDTKLCQLSYSYAPHGHFAHPCQWRLCVKLATKVYTSHFKSCWESCNMEDRSKIENLAPIILQQKMSIRNVAALENHNCRSNLTRSLSPYLMKSKGAGMRTQEIPASSVFASPSPRLSLSEVPTSGRKAPRT